MGGQKMKNIGDTEHRLMPASGFGTEQQVREVMNSLSPSVFVGLLTVKGILTYSNRAALEAVGATLEDVLGKPFDVTPWWRFSEISRKQLREAIDGAAKGFTSRFEFPFQNGNGQVLTMDFTLYPVFDQCGDVAYLIPSARDITQRKLAERALFVTQFAMDNACNAMFQVAVDGHILYANNSCMRLLGYSRDEFLRMRIFDVDLQLPAPKWPERWKELTQHKMLRFESMYRHSEGRAVPVEVADSHIEYEGAEYCFFDVRDITERKAAERRLNHMLHYDSLTGLPNRTLFSERLQELLRDYNALRQPITVAAIGLDRIKVVKEALNHASADEVVRNCALRLRDCAPDADMIARISADEFAMVMMHASADIAAAFEEVAQRVLEAMAIPILIGQQEVFINCSIGMATYPSDADSADELLKNAATALRRSKRYGGNTLHVYSSNSESRYPDRLLMETALRTALRKNQLLLYYQPQLNLSTGKICGVEALLRWQNPENGVVSMGRFIPIAEETGLILQISDWVLREACMQLGIWARQGIMVGRMAVNLSARQFRQKDLVDQLTRILLDTGTDPDLLELELTETMLVNDVDAAIEVLSILKGKGFHVSLDDFGTGYSSLSYLKRFPIDTLKIDQSFVREIPSDPRSSAIVDGIIALGHRLRHNVVAEGVETAEQLSMLYDSGCDIVQGYLFCRPLAAEQLTTRLREPPSGFFLHRDQNSKTVM
jgi:diguanylate cyclase (GGDEF)-like protein/PAS domain S-box-containing protein